MEANKSHLLRRLAAGAQLYFLVITWRSYISDREFFPAISILFDSLKIPAIAHMVVFALLIGSLVFVLIKPGKAEGGLLFLLFYIIAVFLDINRFSQYHLHILAFLFIPATLSDQSVNHYIRYVFALTYLVWGMSLLTDEYTQFVVPSLLPGESGLLHTLTELIPWTLILLGIINLVLFHRITFMVSLFIHLTFAVFFAFGDSIFIMTPWNILFIAASIVVLKNDNSAKLSWKLYLIPTAMMIWLFITYTEVVPPGLGFNYYNGKNLSLTLYLNQAEVENLPADIQEQLKESPDGAHKYFIADGYYSNTYHSTLLPFHKNYLSLGKKFCENLSDRNNAILVLVQGYGQVQGRDFLILTYNDIK